MLKYIKEETLKQENIKRSSTATTHNSQIYIVDSIPMTDKNFNYINQCPNGDYSLDLVCKTLFKKRHK